MELPRFPASSGLDALNACADALGGWADQKEGHGVRMGLDGWASHFSGGEVHEYVLPSIAVSWCCHPFRESNQWRDIQLSFLRLFIMGIESFVQAEGNPWFPCSWFPDFWFSAITISIPNTIGKGNQISDSTRRGCYGDEWRCETHRANQPPMWRYPIVLWVESIRNEAPFPRGWRRTSMDKTGWTEVRWTIVEAELA